jgi:hypothetical protein
MAPGLPERRTHDYYVNSCLRTLGPLRAILRSTALDQIFEISARRYGGSRRLLHGFPGIWNKATTRDIEI